MGMTVVGVSVSVALTEDRSTMITALLLRMTL